MRNMSNMGKRIFKKKISIIGTRGIPNNYGGFEKFTEVLSKSLVQKGCNVLVSCEKPQVDEYITNYYGVELFYFPIKPPKSAILRYIYEFFYDAYSLYIASKRSEVVYMLGYSASFFFFIPRLFGKELWVNPDGIEWRRSKFNIILKFLLKFSEKLMTFWADEIIADSIEIKKYLDSHYNINSRYISYGVYKPSKQIWDVKKLPNILKDADNLKESYWLVVARLEPENNIDVIIEAYKNSNTEKPLIVVGNFSSVHYENRIRNIAENDNQVIFLGGIYNKALLNMLRQNCFAYIHGHSVGGTNPSLLETMAMKNIIVVHDNEFNREVCNDTALYFVDVQTLKDQIETIEENFGKFLELKEKAYQRVINDYSWKKIVDQYEKMLECI